MKGLMYDAGASAYDRSTGQFYLELRDAERRAVRDEVSGRMARFESSGQLVLSADALIGTDIKANA
jgi:hypothetical protein